MFCSLHLSGFPQDVGCAVQAAELRGEEQPLCRSAPQLSTIPETLLTPITTYFAPQQILTHTHTHTQSVTYKLLSTLDCYLIRLQIRRL